MQDLGADHTGGRYAGCSYTLYCMYLLVLVRVSVSVLVLVLVSVLVWLVLVLVLVLSFVSGDFATRYWSSCIAWHMVLSHLASGPQDKKLPDELLCPLFVYVPGVVKPRVLGGGYGNARPPGAQPRADWRYAD